MASIRSLDHEVVAKLRSTVVIHDLAQAVSELVQNALDAGARSIRMRVKLSMLQLEVADDGRGIHPRDMPLIAHRYHTSKTRETKPTFGFRGEALASLAEVSKLVIVSRAAGESATFRKVIKFGQEQSCAPDSDGLERIGTRVHISEFFGKMPVRQRRMVGNVVELEKVKNAIEELALLHPAVLFMLMDADKDCLLVQAQPVFEMVDRFRGLFGPSLSDSMHPVNLTDVDLSLSGIISEKGFYSKSYQFIYVNGRLVRPLRSPLHKLVNALFTSSSLSKITEPDADTPVAMPTELLGIIPASVSVYSRRRKVYQPRTRPEKYGLFVLHLTCPTESLDIAVDARSVTVEFHDWSRVLQIIQTTVTNFLRAKNLLPNEAPTSYVAETEQPTRRIDANLRLFALDPTASDDDDYPVDNLNDQLDHEPVNQNITDLDNRKRSRSPSPPIPSSSCKTIIPVEEQHLSDHSSPPEPQNRPQSSVSAAAKAAYTAEMELFESSLTTTTASVQVVHGHSKFFETAISNHKKQQQTSINPRADRNRSVFERYQQASSPQPTMEIERSKDVCFQAEASLPPEPVNNINYSQDFYEPRNAMRSETFSRLPPESEPLSLSQMIQQWDNPVFETPESDVVQLPLGSFHRYAHYYQMGQTGLDNSFKKSDLMRAQVLGQIECKFIVCLLPAESSLSTSTVLLIDQHAADERIRLERMTKEFMTADTVPIGEPGGVQVHLDPNEIRLLEIHTANFQRWGIHVTFHRVSTSPVPLVFVKRLPKIVVEKVDRAPGILHELLKDHVALLAETSGTSVSIPRVVSKMLNAKACRGAIKFGDDLTLAKCEQILQSLSTCDFPFQCAHGRPSMVPLAIVHSSSSSSAADPMPKLNLHRLRRS